LLADILRDEMKKQGKGVCQNSDGGIFCLLRLGCWLEMDQIYQIPFPCHQMTMENNSFITLLVMKVSCLKRILQDLTWEEF
jgi:hypothetical protein